MRWMDGRCWKVRVEDGIKETRHYFNELSCVLWLSGVTEDGTVAVQKDSAWRSAVMLGDLISSIHSYN